MTPTEEQLWTPREVAAYLRVSIDTVFRYAQSGRLPVELCIGPQRRFKPSAVKAAFQPKEQA